MLFHMAAFRLLVSLLAFVPMLAVAQGCPVGFVCVDTGVYGTVPGIIAGLIQVLLILASLVAFTVFLLGGFYTAVSGGNEQTLGNGKKLMKAALIGFALILGSWMLLSTFVNFFLAPLS